MYVSSGIYKVNFTNLNPWNKIFQYGELLSKLFHDSLSLGQGVSCQSNEDSHTAERNTKP